MSSGYSQPSGYPTPQTNGGYPSSAYPQQNGGTGAYPTQSGYPQQPQQNGGASPYPPTGYSQPPLNGGASPYPPQYPPTGYPQGTQYLSSPVDPRGRSSSFDSLPSAQSAGLAVNDTKPLAQSAETPQQNPQLGEHRPQGGKQTKSPSVKRNILINQHRYGFTTNATWFIKLISPYKTDSAKSLAVSQ